jgi:hypothetical protein
VKRIADPNQRYLRWSLGCAHLELAGSQMPMPGVETADSLVGRPAALRNRFASCGSAAV